MVYNLATIFGDVQYTQNGTVTNPCPSCGENVCSSAVPLWQSNKKNRTALESTDPIAGGG